MSQQNRALAVVVGAGGQIGGAIADALAKTHRLALIDRDAARVSAISERHRDSLPFAVDAAVGSGLDDAFAAIRATAPVAAVAIAVGTTEGGSLAEVDDATWHETVDSNLTSVFRSLRAAIRALLDNGGSICVVGSVHATAPQPGFPAYAAAKAGVASLARQAAAEYGHLGIRINLVTPGWTRTAHTVSRLAPEDQRALADATPLKGAVEPEDIARTAAFLLSPDARHITGADIVVDAGAGLLGAATVLRATYRERLGLPPSG